MKKVGTSKVTTSVFDDPLLNLGSSFNNQTDSDNYVATSNKPSEIALTSGDDDLGIFSPSINRTIKTSRTRKDAPTVSTTNPLEVSNSTPTSTFGAIPEPSKVQPVEESKPKTNPLNTKRVDPISDGDDLFLPSSGAKKGPQKKSNLEEELFGTSAPSRSSNKNLRVGGHDSDSENEFADLGVGAIIEREELDFDMFGKSHVRQYESSPATSAASEGNTSKQQGTSKNSAIRKDDLVLESSDVLSDFESFVSGKENAKKVSSSSGASDFLSRTEVKSVTVDSSYDIDAYISQQEESSGGGLFD